MKSIKNIRNIMWIRPVLIIGVLLLIIISFAFTLYVSNDIERSEKQKMEIWAEATEQILHEDFNDMAFEIVEQNTSIPIIVTDKNGEVLTYRNIEPPEHNEKEFFNDKLARIRGLHKPIIIEISATERQYLYYDDSFLLKSIRWFPMVQGVLLITFFALLLWLFGVEKKREEEKVWVGLSKETAHQLGTPISSLEAWQEILKSTVPSQTVDEMGKDVDRLKTIAERFSKVGSTPKLELHDIRTVVNTSIDYMKGRTSQRVLYEIKDNATNTEVMICEPLIQWVLENLSKNAVDAMEGEGHLTFHLFNEDDKVVIEVTDTGKGMERKIAKHIFEPGFTTKKRGWGLGLSLARRIITEYHNGRIFVKHSEPGHGTTFRIEL